MTHPLSTELREVAENTKAQRSLMRNALRRAADQLKLAEAVVEAAEAAFERRRKVTPEHWWILEEDLWRAEAAIEAYRAATKPKAKCEHGVPYEHQSKFCSICLDIAMGRAATKESK